MVDDDPQVLASWSRAMLGSKAMMSTARGQPTKRSMQELEARPFDLVITDLIMPEKEGLETIAEMKTLTWQCPRHRDVRRRSHRAYRLPGDGALHRRRRDAGQTVRAQLELISLVSNLLSEAEILTVPPITLVERYLADSGRDELAAALLVARTLDSPVDDHAVRTDTWANCGGRFATRVSQEGAAQSLAEFLRDEGFKASDNLQSLDASRIDKCSEFASGHSDHAQHSVSDGRHGRPA